MNLNIQTIRRRALLRMIGFAALLLLAASARPPEEKTGRFVCTNPDCEPYIYDPALGEPILGIVPGTAWKDIQEDKWVCPVCGDPKHKFHRYP